MIKKLLLLFICLILCSVALKSVVCATENPTPFLEQKDVRHRTLKTFITQSMSHHFTMKGSEATYIWEKEGFTRKFYEMRGFTMQPQVQPITEADRLNGIDLKFNLIVRSEVYREKESLGTYGDWKNGSPPWINIHATKFHFERRNGVFIFTPNEWGKACKPLGKFQITRN